MAFPPTPWPRSAPTNGPGNVRELENVVERAVALESERRIEAATLPDNLRNGQPATSKRAPVD